MAAIVGLILGGGGVGLGWLVSSNSAGSTSDDITTACGIVTGLGPMKDISTDAGKAQHDRLGAAYSLALAASATNPEFKQFSDQLMTAINAIAQTFKADNPKTVQALRQATDYCHSR